MKHLLRLHELQKWSALCFANGILNVQCHDYVLIYFLQVLHSLTSESLLYPNIYAFLLLFCSTAVLSHYISWLWYNSRTCIYSLFSITRYVHMNQVILPPKFVHAFEY